MTSNKHSTTGKASLNGTDIAYEVTGTGHPLVLVHAGIADQRMWDEQVSVFAQEYQVIRYDLRGFGQTPMPTEPFSYYQDLHSLLQFLNIEHTYLLGSSMGGAVAIDFTLAYPNMVDALVLADSNISGFEFSNDEPPELYKEHTAALERGDIARAAQVEAQYWVCGVQRTIEQVDARIIERVAEMNVIPLTNKVDEQENEQSLDPLAISRLGEISVPTLVFIGDMDDHNIVQCSTLLATQIPRAQKVVMPGTAHFPSMERPGEFNQIVLDFLASL